MTTRITDIPVDTKTSFETLYQVQGVDSGSNQGKIVGVGYGQAGHDSIIHKFSSDGLNYYVAIPIYGRDDLDQVDSLSLAYVQVLREDGGYVGTVSMDFVTEEEDHIKTEEVLEGKYVMRYVSSTEEGPVDLKELEGYPGPEVILEVLLESLSDEKVVIDFQSQNYNNFYGEDGRYRGGTEDPQETQDRN